MSLRGMMDWLHSLLRRPLEVAQSSDRRKDRDQRREFNHRQVSRDIDLIKDELRALDSEIHFQLSVKRNRPNL